MRDQTGLIRDVVKWDYELRYPEQVAGLVDRGMAITKSAPAGPVYLGLPREPLAEPWPDGLAIDNALQAIPTRPAPDPEAVLQAAKWLEKAHHPLIICQRGILAVGCLRFYPILLPNTPSRSWRIFRYKKSTPLCSPHAKRFRRWHLA